MRLIHFLIVLLAAFVSFACSASSASAATVTFLLDLTTPGQFKVLAQASADDNFGIVRYGIPLTGPITNIDHVSPNTLFATSADGTGPAGFTSGRSADGDPTLLATQDTITPTPHIIRGFGQEDSSFAEKGVTPLIPVEQPDWGVPLLIATGTYNHASGTLDFNRTSIDLFAGVLSNPSGPPMTIGADLVLVIIPEPATAILAGAAFSVVCLFGRRKPIVSLLRETPRGSSLHERKAFAAS